MIEFGDWRFQKFTQSEEDMAEMRRFGMQPTLLLTNDGSAPIMSGGERVALVDMHAKAKRGDAYKTPCEKRDQHARLIANAPRMYRLLHALTETPFVEDHAEEINAILQEIEQ